MRKLLTLVALFLIAPINLVLAAADSPDFYFLKFKYGMDLDSTSIYYPLEEDRIPKNFRDVITVQKGGRRRTYVIDVAPGEVISAADYQLLVGKHGKVFVDILFRPVPKTNRNGMPVLTKEQAAEEARLIGRAEYRAEIRRTSAQTSNVIDMLLVETRFHLNAENKLQPEPKDWREKRKLEQSGTMSAVEFTFLYDLEPIRANFVEVFAQYLSRQVSDKHLQYQILVDFKNAILPLYDQIHTYARRHPQANFDMDEVSRYLIEEPVAFYVLLALEAIRTHDPIYGVEPDPVLTAQLERLEKKVRANSSPKWIKLIEKTLAPILIPPNRNQYNFLGGLYVLGAPFRAEPLKITHLLREQAMVDCRPQLKSRR